MKNKFLEKAIEKIKSEERNIIIKLIKAKKLNCIHKNNFNMWMTKYISEIKRQFRDVYKFEPIGGTKDEPTFKTIPDGIYPMEIDGQVDNVKIIDGNINCCNF